MNVTFNCLLNPSQHVSHAGQPCPNFFFRCFLDGIHYPQLYKSPVSKNCYTQYIYNKKSLTLKHILIIYQIHPHTFHTQVVLAQTSSTVVSRTACRRRTSHARATRGRSWMDGSRSPVGIVVVSSNIKIVKVKLI